jgi:uncharacterized protein (TIGR02599 family)
MKRLPPVRRALRRHAFTLVELLTATAVLVLLLALMVGIINQTSSTWRHTTSQIETFREARTAFETITRRLSQATLNTYWDYLYPNNNPNHPDGPSKYVRQSELRFASGRTESLVGSSTPPRPLHGVFFNAPLGFVDDANFQQLNNLLNTWGYYVEFNSDHALGLVPGFMQSRTEPRWRFRLMEFREPADELGIYNYTSPNAARPNSGPQWVGNQWFSDRFTSTPPSSMVAENIVALIIHPKLSSRDDPTGNQLAPNFTYRSDNPSATNSAWSTNPMLNPKHQLPPLVQVTMVAIDEASAARLQAMHGSQMPDLGLNGLFTNAANFEQDLRLNSGGANSSLEQKLIDENITYRIFTTTVSIAGAKWSTTQTE